MTSHNLTIHCPIPAPCHTSPRLLLHPHAGALVQGRDLRELHHRAQPLRRLRQGLAHLPLDAQGALLPHRECATTRAIIRSHPSPLPPFPPLLLETLHFACCRMRTMCSLQGAHTCWWTEAGIGASEGVIAAGEHTSDDHAPKTTLLQLEVRCGRLVVVLFAPFSPLLHAEASPELEHKI